MVEKVKNRGTGAGGSNTNTNGKKYENETLLSNNFEVVEKKMIKKNNKTYYEIKFYGSDIKYIHLEQSIFNMFMEEIGEKNNQIKSAPGCRNPDDAYVDLENKKIFIVEKKFQQTGGSVEEKIQTGFFKKKHYSKLYPNFEINYMYCLSSWFKNIDNKSVIEALNDENIPVFFNSDKDFDKQIVKYIIGKSNQKNNQVKTNPIKNSDTTNSNHISGDKIKSNKKTMSEFFTNELPVRHYIKKFDHKWIGEYDIKKDLIISNGNEYTSLTDFALQHLLHLDTGRTTVNGWVECEIYLDNKWISANVLRINKKFDNNKIIRKSVGANKNNSYSDNSDSDNSDSNNSDSKNDNNNKKIVKKSISVKRYNKVIEKSNNKSDLEE